MESNQNDEQHDQNPRLGRLLAVCVAAVVFCGVLVWFASTYLADCCTFTFLERLLG